MFREAVISIGRPGIGETPIFDEGSIRGMSGYGMTASGAKQPFGGIGEGRVLARRVVGATSFSPRVRLRGATAGADAGRSCPLH
jgi:hypothetical protein